MAYVCLVSKIPKALHIYRTAFFPLPGSECPSHSQWDALSGPIKALLQNLSQLHGNLGIKSSSEKQNELIPALRANSR